MSDVLTIARPYAHAVFDIALDQNKLKEWSDTLKTLAIIAQDKEMQLVLANPLISKEQLLNLFESITGKLDQHVINLLSDLADRKRLTLLPSISKIYEKCLAERERTVDVRVVSAFPIDDARLKRLQAALQNYLKRKVNMRLIVDRELIGGAKIYADDQVIDGSLRGKLNRLSERLCI